MNRPLSEKTDGAPAETAGFHEDYTLYLLAKASEIASAEFHAELAAEGVSVGEWRVLAVLWTGEASVGALAGACLMKQPTMTKLLDRMAAAGWVERLGRGGDRRRVRLGLTEAGRAQASALIPKARAHEARLLGALPAGEGQALRAALRGLIARRMGGGGAEA